MPWSLPWLTAFIVSSLFFHCVPKLSTLMSEGSLHMSRPLAVVGPSCIFIQGVPSLGSTLLPMASCQMNVGREPPVAVWLTLRPWELLQPELRGWQRVTLAQACVFPSCPSLRHSKCHFALSTCAQGFLCYF